MPRTPTVSPEQKAAILARKIQQEVIRSAGAGLNAARIFFTARCKEAVSVPAEPRIPLRGPVLPGHKKGPIIGYRAGTKATPGAPPRKLSGRGRGSVQSQMVGPLTAVIGANARAPIRYGKRGNLIWASAGAKYMQIHELSKKNPHPFIVPTFQKFKNQLAVIVGQKVTLRT